MFTFSLNGKIGLFQCSLKYTSIQSLPSFYAVTRLIKSVNMEYVPPKHACLVKLHFCCGTWRSPVVPYIACALPRSPVTRSKRKNNIDHIFFVQPVATMFIAFE